MSDKKQLAVDIMFETMIGAIPKNKHLIFEQAYIKAQAIEKENMINLVQALKNYTHESHTILGHDEREAEEFVDIFLNQKKYGK